MSFVDKIQTALEGLMKKSPDFDPSVFQSSLAQQTSWEPLKPGGTNVDTHELKEIHSGQFQFVLKKKAKLFPFFFVVPGLLFGGVFPLGLLIENGWNPGVLITFLLGAMLGGVGFGILYKWSTPIVLDFDRGVFYRGRAGLRNLKGNQDHCLLKEVGGLQILAEHITSSSGNSTHHSFRSYELNFVLNDGSRHNLVDHGKLETIQENAHELSCLLKIPVWDKTNPPSSSN